jgi:SSS family solute:Na+ symporter
MLVDTPISLGLAGYERGYTPGSFLWIVNNIYFQYFSVLITVVSALVMVVVSLATAEPDYDRMKGLTFATQSRQDRAESRASWNWRDVAASAFVVAAIAGAYVYFTG